MGLDSEKEAEGASDEEKAASRKRLRAAVESEALVAVVGPPEPDALVSSVEVLDREGCTPPNE